LEIVVAGSSASLKDLPPFTLVAKPIAEAPPLYARPTSYTETSVFDAASAARDELTSTWWKPITSASLSWLMRVSGPLGAALADTAMTSAAARKTAGSDLR